MATNNPQVEVAVRNACSQLGEGPCWDVASQTLFFVDIIAREVHRWNPATQQHDVKTVGDTANIIVPRQQGGFVLGLGHSFAVYDWDTNTTTTIREVEPGTGSRFNDGKCDTMGRMWAGTLTESSGGAGFVEGAGSLYKLDRDRTVTKVHPGMTISNGMAWSSDNRTFFYNDSGPRNIYAFDFDETAGTISSERTVLQVPADLGVPDGMTIDTEDKLWVALYDGGAVIRVDPQTGQILQTVTIPTRQTTSVAWGGRNLDELYVTSAAFYSPEEMQNQPLAGSLFRVTGLGASGRPANAYNDQA